MSTFTPPARTAVPPILPVNGAGQSPLARRLFSHYRSRPEGINVFILSNGVVTEEEPDSESTFWLRGDGTPYVTGCFYGGHDDYELTDEQAGLLQAAGYTVVDNTPPAPTPPVITSLSPSSGVDDTTVSIFGSNLAEVTDVTFDGDSIAFTIMSSTLIQFVVPASSNEGGNSVVASNVYGSSDTLTFTVVVPVPGAPPDFVPVPTQGLAGTAIELIGSGLAAATEVRFNGTPISFEIVSDSLITITAPVLAAGDYAINVESPFGTGGSAFSITEAAGPGDPHPGADILLESSDFLLLEDGTSSLLQES